MRISFLMGFLHAVLTHTIQQRDRYKVHIILNNYTLNRILKQKKEIRLQYTHLNFLLI